MAQKEAADTNSQNILIKVAKMIGSSMLGVTPLMVKEQYETLKTLTGLLDNEGWDNWCNKLASEGMVDQDTVDGIKEFARYPFPWGGIMMILAILQVKMTDLKSVMDIYGLDRLYDVQAKTTPHPAPIDNLVRSMIIDPARATENRAMMKKHGLDDQQIDNVILSYYKTTDEDTVRQLFLRGIITTEGMYNRMYELGYTKARVDEIIQTWEMIPGPQDLFTMVAKEAFEPDIYTALGLDKEFPVAQVEWLKKQGISEDWAKKFWIAHWEQPSIGQGFEMLHRGVIGRDTLDLLFRAVEIPDFWRDKLNAIAYQPLTRVDVRRMHDLGVIDDQRLIKAYMDLGYDPDNALAMANFTIQYNANTEKQLTRSVILESYRENLISRTQATELLTEQGYSTDLAGYYLEMEDYNRDKIIRDTYIDNTRERMLLNVISPAQARDTLNQLGLRGEKIDSLMDTWQLDAYKFAAIPTKSELDNFLINGIIDQGSYRTIMARHGFSDILIDWYLKDLERALTVTKRGPTKADITAWYKKKHITVEQFREELTVMGYADKYIDLYIKSV